MVKMYPEDVTAVKTWDVLSKDDSAYLIDVRTSVEWHFVGIPDLSPIKKELIKIEWLILPNMTKNMKFAEQLRNIVTDQNASLFFLCRTGGRSREAAMNIMSLGCYKACYNVADGFEGALSPKMHRGEVNGWKASNLSWRQD